jgi:hypothetical protein
MKNIGLSQIPAVKGHVVNISLNLVLVSVFFIFFGAVVSFFMAKLFPKYDEEWKNQPLWYRMGDVSIEISLLVLAAFWLTYISHIHIPIFPVSSPLERYIESFGGQMVFVYAVFIFMDTLDDKLMHVFPVSS